MYVICIYVHVLDNIRMYVRMFHIHIITILSMVNLRTAVAKNIQWCHIKK